MGEPTTTKLSFDGDLTMAYAASAHARLCAALAAGTTVEVAMGDITALDLSFVQVLIAARKSAQAAGKVLRLAAPASGVFLDALRRGGLLGGPPSADDRFWQAQQ